MAAEDLLSRLFSRGALSRRDPQLLHLLGLPGSGNGVWLSHGAGALPALQPVWQFRGHAEYLDGVLKQVEAASRVSTDKYAYILSTATEYVEKNFNREISMNEVAEKVSVSYTYFSRLFKEQMHQSFSEYVVSVRMREAKRLIQEDPSIKMKDVAALVGYESVYAFSRAFKQYFHVSPKQARA